MFPKNLSFLYPRPLQMPVRQPGMHFPHSTLVELVKVYLPFHKKIKYHLLYLITPDV